MSLVIKCPNGSDPIGRLTTTILLAELQAAISKSRSSFILWRSAEVSMLLISAVPNSECNMLISFLTAEDFFFRGGNIGFK